MWGMSITTKLAKAVMKLREVTPDPGDGGGLQEVFNLRSFLEAPQTVRNQIMLQSSQAKYREEVEYPWDAYFDMEIAPLLAGRMRSTWGASMAAAALRGTSDTS